MQTIAIIVLVILALCAAMAIACAIMSAAKPMSEEEQRYEDEMQIRAIQEHREKAARRKRHR